MVKSAGLPGGPGGGSPQTPLLSRLVGGNTAPVAVDPGASGAVMAGIAPVAAANAAGMGGGSLMGMMGQRGGEGGGGHDIGSGSTGPAGT